MAHNGAYSIRSLRDDPIYFTGPLLVGNNASGNCSVPGGSSSIELNNSCQYGAGLSGTAITIASLATSFVGRLTTDDPFNTSDSLGTALYENIDDWNTFSNPFRAWGKNGSSPVHSTTRGPCDTDGETCRIWDWRLAASDAIVRNRSGDGQNANTAFPNPASGNCPSGLPFESVFADTQTPQQTFLVNALELVGDYLGDDDGLCEATESCLYSPNFGAYQGEGNYAAGGYCTVNEGTLSGTGIKIYAYPTNGG